MAKNLFFSFWAIVLITLSVHATAQPKKLHGTILDLKSNEPVSYATISVFNQPIGTYANEAGNFELIAPEFSDSVVFSAIGYEPIIIAIDKLSEDAKIYLTKTPETLQTVKVATYSGRYQTIGVKPSKVRNAINIFPGSEYVYRFTLESDSKKRIVRFRFFSNDRGMIQKAIYRVNLYYVDESGKPGTLLNTGDHLIEVDTSKQSFDINLYSDEYYIDSRGIFIGLESIGYIDANGNFTYGNSTTPLYFKFNTDKSYPPKCYRRINKFQWDTVREGLSKNTDKPFLIPCFEIDIAE